MWDTATADVTSVWAYLHPRLQNYQTLITGLLAVGAALGTIRVMMYTETRQADRHRQLMAIGNRRDKLIIEHAANPQIQESGIILNKIRHVKMEFNLPTEGLVNALLDNEEICQTEISQIFEFVSRQAFVDARPLFDGEAYRSYERLVALAGALRGQPHFADRGFGRLNTQGTFIPGTGYEERKSNARKEIVEHIQKKEAICIELEAELQKFIGCLRRLVEIYKQSNFEI